MDCNEQLFLMKSVDSSAAPYEESGVRKDGLSFYAEYRRDTDNKSDLYGGDAYPVVWTESEGGVKYGMILVSDGLGSGSFTHEYLRKKYENDAREESEKLYDFLTGLYGENFFDDDEAVKYALRSFSPCQPDSLYMTLSGKERFDEPFYQRSSQYLASRIVCVGAFYKFRKRVKEYFENGFSAENVKRLRDDIERYIDGESDADGNLVFGGKNLTDPSVYTEWLESESDCLRKNVWKTFDTINDPYKDKAVYLPCTFSCWVFVDDGKKVNGAALFLGDSRCYKIDLIDGVQQISVDDVSANAEHDGAMTVIQTFGFNHNAKTVDGIKTHDGAIKATIVSLDKPCALFCCSDGVYDTCPTYDAGTEGMIEREPSEKMARFELFREVNNLAFEYNFLDILRNSNGLDDLRHRLVRSFYAHAIPDDVDCRGARSPVSAFVNEKHSGGVKLDDSATLGIAFFSRGDKDGEFPVLITELRNTNTVLDDIWKAFSGEETKDLYCANLDDSEYSESKKSALINEIIMTEYGGNEFIDILVKNALEHYSDIKAHRDETGKWYAYGIPNKAMKSESALRSVFCRNFEPLLQKAVDEFDEIYPENFVVDEAGNSVNVDDDLIKKIGNVKERFGGAFDDYLAQMRSGEGLECGRGIINDVLEGNLSEEEFKDGAGKFYEKYNGCLKAVGSDKAVAVIEELKKESEFVFVSNLCNALTSNDVEKDEAIKKAQEWIRGNSALYLPETEGYTDNEGKFVKTRNVSTKIICDDQTLVALCKLAASKSSDGFSAYFGKLGQMTDEIFNSIPAERREPYEAFASAAKAKQSFDLLSADDVSLARCGGEDERDYSSVRVNGGRKPIYANKR